MTKEEIQNLKSEMREYQRQREDDSSLSPGSAFAVIESMRQKGYVVQLDNGLDGTWEAQFYKPTPYGSTNEVLEKTYGAGDTMLLAVTEAAKNTPKRKLSHSRT